MNERLYTLQNTVSDIRSINKPHVEKSLELGNIVYLPNYYFELKTKERAFLTEDILAEGRKNISYDPITKALSGFHHVEISTLKTFMQRFADFAKTLIDSLAPTYKEALHWGRTSYRPAQIKGRALSKRKDDTRLHVDSFAATPVHGLRILRIFCNINPHGESRVWQIGEPFEKVLTRFAHRIPNYSHVKAKWLKWIRTTKTLRSPYDHYMLHLHDSMKLDDAYQQQVPKERLDFPALSTWIVFTDHVSHAALSGQYLLEQTFYLPVTHMENKHLSPLHQWESIKNRSLV